MKGSKAIRTGYLKSIQIGLLVLAVATTGFGGWAVAQDEDKLSKFLLIKLSREQSRVLCTACLLYTSPSPRDKRQSRMPSSA